jgi:hypothetical protein
VLDSQFKFLNSNSNSKTPNSKILKFSNSVVSGIEGMIKKLVVKQHEDN